ncbi:MAG: metalloregulator ArsR/SmtB family transcription factor [Pseudomonadota bacterium]
MSLDQLLHVFRAVGEETRLRIGALLRRGELTVSELTQILGQSQPRVSRHLKILADAGLVERHREGSWIFYRFSPVDRDAEPAFAAISEALRELNASDDRVLARDRERFEQSRAARAAAAAQYFRANAGDWDRIRGLHIPEPAIEAKMREILGDERSDLFIDFGTGTGRMLTAFADLYSEGVGYDLSREMLAVARARLEEAGVAHAQVRLGDALAAPAETASADIVCIHHVLHYLAEPAAAVAEAARVLKPGGRLIISDFAPHDFEFLRDEHAHRRLGFSEEEVAGWAAAVGLEPASSATLRPDRNDDKGLTVKIWLFKASDALRPFALTEEAAANAVKAVRLDQSIN